MLVNFLLQHPPLARMSVHKTDSNGRERGGQPHADQPPPQARQADDADSAAPPADVVQTADDWVSLGGTVSADLYDQLGSMSPVPNTVRDGMVAGATIVDTDAAGHPQPEDKTRQLLAQTYGR